MNRLQGWAGNTQFDSSYTDQGDDPNVPDPLWFAMAPNWEIIQACTEGTPYLRLNAERYLPQQPLELHESWQGRVSRSTFSNYFSKVIRTAVGLILRKPIYLEGGDETYWDEWRQDVCRDGSTDLDAFAQDLLFSALSFGHSSVLIDYPDTSNVRTLAEEQGANLKPYLVKIDTPNLIGWQQDPRANAGKLQQLRIREAFRRPKGRFGVEYINRVRVLEPGKFEVWEESAPSSNTGWQIVESGTMSVADIPVSTVYGGDKRGVLFSHPPALALAYQNIRHYQAASDLSQSLHVAAQPILVGAGMDDLNNTNDSTNPIGLSVNNMVLTGPKSDSEIYYVSPNVTSFDSQQTELQRLVDEMRALSIAMLTEQNTTNASGTAKALDRIDSNSVLATVSKSLQQCLQDAVNIAGEYAGVEPPEVTIPRDFDVQIMEPTAVTAINTLYNSGIVDQQTALEMLQHGEFLPEDVEIEEVMSQAENDELKDIEMQVERTSALSEVGEGTQPNEDE